MKAVFKKIGSKKESKLPYIDGVSRYLCIFKYVLFSLHVSVCFSAYYVK